MDMYKVKGRLCFSCYKGFKCIKHPLLKNEMHMTRKDFDELDAPKKKKAQFDRSKK